HGSDYDAENTFRPCKDVKQKPLHEWRVFDSPIAGIPCRAPIANGQRYWNDQEDCAMQIGTSMDNMRQMVPAKRVALDKPSKGCKPPDVVKSLPDRLRRKILEIWEERDPEGDCFQQQRRTRLAACRTWRIDFKPDHCSSLVVEVIFALSMNMVQLRRLWAGYKKGEPCSR
ncbi:hypothetical protein OSTOST_08934, partial [Ostertagia ostertagi]